MLYGILSARITGSHRCISDTVCQGAPPHRSPQTGHLPFRKIIDGGVVSYEVGAVKPESEIYEKLLAKYDLDPSDCIFYDDIKNNVEAARAFGIESHLVASEEELLRELERLK